MTESPTAVTCRPDTFGGGVSAEQPSTGARDPEGAAVGAVTSVGAVAWADAVAWARRGGLRLGTDPLALGDLLHQPGRGGRGRAGDPVARHRRGGQRPHGQYQRRDWPPRAHRPQALLEVRPPPVARGPEPVPENRRLDEPPRRRGQRDCHRDFDEPQPGRGGSGTGDRVGQRDHRPVPQVNPVGADPDPAQGRQAGHRGDDAGTRGGGDQAGGARRGEEEAGRVDRPVVAGEVAGGPGQHDESDHACGVQAPDLRGRDRRQGSEREGQGERGADQQCGGVRIGAVVDQGRVTGRVLQGHDQRRHSGQDQRGRDASTPSVQPEQEQP